jgi:zinc D-Ala-D-Ala carboxypeptidase
VPDVRLRLGRSAEQMQFSAQATEDLKKMFEAAANDGVELVFGSGYRSYELQKQFYDSYVAQDGQEAADRYSARPGTSEHQTGLTVDITSPSGQCHLEICFEDMPEGQWLKANAHTYGFIIRYLDGKEHITGYQYEPWHLRYVGEDLATELHDSGETMEEFFGLYAKQSSMLDNFMQLAAVHLHKQNQCCCC